MENVDGGGFRIWIGVPVTDSGSGQDCSQGAFWGRSADSRAGVGVQDSGSDSGFGIITLGVRGAELGQEDWGWRGWIRWMISVVGRVSTCGLDWVCQPNLRNQSSISNWLYPPAVQYPHLPRVHRHSPLSSLIINMPVSTIIVVPTPHCLPSQGSLASPGQKCCFAGPHHREPVRKHIRTPQN